MVNADSSLLCRKSDAKIFCPNGELRPADRLDQIVAIDLDPRHAKGARRICVRRLSQLAALFHGLRGYPLAAFNNDTVVERLVMRTLLRLGDRTHIYALNEAS